MTATVRPPLRTRAVAVLGAVVVFLVSLALSSLLHAGHPLAGRLVARAIGHLLEGTFEGRLVVERMGRLEPGGIEGIDVTMYDPAGKVVLAVRSVRLRVGLLATAWEAVRHPSDLDLAIERIRAERVEVSLDSDPDGGLALAHAFRVRRSGTSSALQRRVRVVIGRLSVASGHVHGAPGGAEIDATVAHLVASVETGTGNTKIEVHRSSANLLRGLSVPARGTTIGRVELPSPSGAAIGVSGTFDGFASDVPLALHATLDGDHLEVVGDVPRATPEALHSLVPALRLGEDASLHVQAGGRLPELDAGATLALGEGALEAHGKVTLATEIAFELSLAARRLDLSSLDASLPHVSLSADGTARGKTRPGGFPEGTFALHVEPTRVGPIALPAAMVRGSFGSQRADLTFDVSDRSVAGHGTLGVAFKADPKLTADVTLGVSSLESALWSALYQGSGSPEATWPRVRGTASVHARGSYDVGLVDAQLDARVGALSIGPVAVEAGELSASVRGALANPSLDARVALRGVEAASRRIDSIEAGVNGGPSWLAISAEAYAEGLPDLRARTNVDLRSGVPSLAAVELTASRGDARLVARAGRVRFGSGGVEVDRLRVEGAGAPLEGDLGIRGAAADVRLASTDLDLGVLSAVLLPEEKLSGHLELDGAARLGAAEEEAHVHLALRDATGYGVERATARVDLALAQGALNGTADVSLGPLGQAALIFDDVRPAGSALAPTAWRDASGTFVYQGQLELAELAARLGGMRRRLGLGGVSGTLLARGVLKRDRPRSDASARGRADAPSAEVTLWTEGLRVPSDPPLHDVELQLTTEIEGRTGATQLKARAVDKGGVFATASVETTLPFPERWATPWELVQVLPSLPLDAELSLPRRALSAYPELVRPASVQGDVELAARVSGTLAAPRVSLRGSGYGVHLSDADLAVPVDLRIAGQYDGARAFVRAVAERPEKGVLLDATSSLYIPGLGLGGSDGAAWQGEGFVRLHGVALESIPLFAQRGIRGKVRGTFTLQGINASPALEGELDVSGLEIDQASFPTGKVVVRLIGESALASAQLDQVDGGVSATASGHVKVQPAGLPALDQDFPLDVWVAMRRTRAAALYPLFLRGVLAHLDGRLDGSLHLRKMPGWAGDSESVLEGAFDFTEGTFQVPQIGQEFRDARAQIVMSETGTLVLRDVSARGTTGQLRGSAVADLRGGAFHAAEGSVFIDEKSPIPLTIEGVSFGEAWGELRALAKRDGKGPVNVDIQIPTLHVDLPQSASRGVQALADHPTIRIGTQRGKKFLRLATGEPVAARASDDIPWHVAFHLGQDVVMKRGSMLELTIGGDPTVDLTDTARVSGQVQFSSGKIDILGKKFEVDAGAASFSSGDASNPDVAVTARWDAPDGTRVYADYVGPMRSGKLSFRAEPAHPESEIMGILLFGTSDDSDAGMSQGTGAMAWTAGGATASDMVNQAISSVAPINVSTRVDTTEAQNPAPEVAVQISPQVTAELSYRTRQDIITQRPDRVSVTVDWRFMKSWSVATTLGDQGSSVVDLLWQYRY